jgi:Putative Zn-dependent protease, contains TPR repeats
MKAESGQIKQVEGRLAELLQAEVSDETGEEIYEAMARGYLSTFQITDATQCLEFWSQWQRDNVLPRLWMGDMWRQLNNSTRAADEYRKVLEIDPHHSEARIKLAQILLEKLKLEEAEPLLVGVLAEQPESPDALLGLADIRRRQGSLKEAQSLVHDALVLDLRPNQVAAALATLGQVAVEDRQYVRAAQLLDQSNSLNSNLPATHLALAASLRALGQEDLAALHRAAASRIQEQATRMVTVIQRTLAEPDNPDPRCEAGLILMEQGLWQPGAEWLKTALALDPGHPGANEGLARYYEMIGDSSAAARHRQHRSSSPEPTATVPEHQQ